MAFLKNRGFVLVVLLVLFFFVILVRTVGLLHNNALFLYDNGRDFLYVKRIVVDHKLLLIGPISGLEGYFHGVLWYYLLVIPFLLGGGNPIAGTWFMAVMSTLSVVVAFVVLKKIMNVYAAFLGVLFLGFAEFSVATTKFIWNPYPIVWLMPIYFLGIYLISKRTSWGIFLISAVQGLVLHFEAVYGVGILPGYLILLVVYLHQKSNLVQKIQYAFIAIALLCIPMLPSLAFDLRHEFLISKSLIKTIQTGGGNITHKNDDRSKSLPERFQLRLDDLAGNSVRSITKNGYLNYFLFGLSLMGVFMILRTKKKEKEKVTIIALTSIVILSPFFVFLSLKYNVWGYYWIGTAPLYAMLVAFIFGYLMQKYHKPSLFIILAILIFAVASPWKVLPYWYKGDLDPSPQVLSTQLGVIRTIYKDAGDNKFSVYEQTPPVYDWIYRYLLWWQGSKVYHYVPTDTKQKFVYVILEGVPEDQDGIFFKKNRLHLTTNPVQVYRFGQLPIVEKFITTPQEESVDPNLFPQL